MQNASDTPTEGMPIWLVAVLIIVGVFVAAFVLDALFGAGFSKILFGVLKIVGGLLSLLGR